MSWKLLKDFIEEGGDSLNKGCDLFNFIYENLATNIVVVNGEYYYINLEFYQDIPSYEIAQLDLSNYKQL